MAELEKAVKKTTKKAKELLDSEVDIHLAQQVVDDVVTKMREKDLPLPDDVLEGIEDIVEEYGPRGPHPALMLGAGMVIGLAVGGYFGYRYAEKKLSLRFEELLNEETEQVKEHYAAKLAAKKDKPSTDALADMAAVRRQEDQNKRMTEELGYKPPGEGILQVATEQSEARDIARAAEEAANNEAEAIVNAFDARDREAEAAIPKWDYSVELKQRDPRKPYVIHIDEWSENESDYTLVEYTWYEGDSVLADDNDIPIDFPDDKVGLDNLENRFGHGSGDANVVFIRNDVIESLYEINRSNGSYEQEVHGFDPDQLSHSEDRHRGRHRFDDD